MQIVMRGKCIQYTFMNQRNEQPHDSWSPSRISRILYSPLTTDSESNTNPSIKFITHRATRPLWRLQFKVQMPKNLEVFANRTRRRKRVPTTPSRVKKKPVATLCYLFSNLKTETNFSLAKLSGLKWIELVVPHGELHQVHLVLTEDNALSPLISIGAVIRFNKSWREWRGCRQQLPGLTKSRQFSTVQESFKCRDKTSDDDATVWSSSPEIKMIISIPINKRNLISSHAPRWLHIILITRFYLAWFLYHPSPSFSSSFPFITSSWVVICVVQAEMK